MSDTPTEVQTPSEPSQPIAPQPRRRSRKAKLLEFLFWIALSFLVAWILIQNVDSILPANNF